MDDHKIIAAELYSDIASAAESGWDFSSRWLKKPTGTLSDMVTKQIIPVDLNAILCFNELTLEKFSRLLGKALHPCLLTSFYYIFCYDKNFYNNEIYD